MRAPSGTLTMPRGSGKPGSTDKGYRGVLASITRNPDGTISMPNICEGTNVGDLAFYLARARHTNDLHGLGAFVIMNEQMRKSGKK
jgi:unsaturated rhamnogalacturonyl hydrolase